MNLTELQTKCSTCTTCELANTRQNVVFGEGHPNARLMLIGEAPGQEEDRTARPFVGQAGQLLEQILGAVGITRDEIFIANVVKCRPPNNRNPEPAEILSCEHWLLEQISLIRPQIIITLGNVPTQWALETTLGITKTRGTWTEFKKLSAPIPLLPMFHPAYLLRNAIRTVGGPKWLTWQDIKAVKVALETLPDKKELQLEVPQITLF
jgi:uracil-DNA glycosylase